MFVAGVYTVDKTTEFHTNVELQRFLDRPWKHNWTDQPHVSPSSALSPRHFSAALLQDYSESASGASPEGESRNLYRLFHRAEGTVGQVKDRNSPKLCTVVEECGSLKTYVFGLVRRTLSGPGGGADPHGHTACSNMNSTRPVLGSTRGITFACGHTPRFWACRQNGEATGTSPVVLHYFTYGIPIIGEASPLSSLSGHNY